MEQKVFRYQNKILEIPINIEASLRVEPMKSLIEESVQIRCIGVFPRPVSGEFLMQCKIDRG
jgi:hypothetical protein